MNLSPTERRLLNGTQRDFPLEARPFARIGAGLGIGEAEALALIGRLRAQGVVSRMGAVVAPNTLGASTLAAMAVPEARIEAVAARVSARAEVNHNYARAHAVNLWFVVTAADRAAAALRARRRFAEVRTAVLHGAPGPRDALAGLKAREVILAPLLMCDGQCARDVLPRAFGLAAPVILRFGRRFTLCPPLGLLPGLTRLIVARAVARALREGLRPEDATLLIVGHGSSRDPASRRTTLWHAAGARAAAVFGSVRVAFLDEQPVLEEGLRRLSGPSVAVGLFAADGLHAGRDLPGAIARYSHLPVHDLGAIGADPGIPDLVLDQAAAWRPLAVEPRAI